MKKLYAGICLCIMSLMVHQPLWAQLENLGPTVNSPSNEMQPIITPDGKTLWFCRENHPDNMGGLPSPGALNQDIWHSTAQAGGGWGDAKNMKNLNTAGNDYVSSVTPDGNTMLIGRSIVRRTKTGWTDREDLHIKGFSNKSKYSMYFLANDGKTLLISYNDGASVGQEDLYVSFLQGDGEFSKPINLGKTINTFGQEFSPFLASDGVTMFFSSDGHPGTLGGNDIYVTRRLDNSWRSWSKPENLGPTINTPSFDAYFVIPACGDYAYMASKANSLGGTDIFRLPIPSFAKPKPVLLLSGTILDAATNDVLNTSIEYKTANDMAIAGVATTNPATGEFTVVLPVGQKYIFYAKAPNYQTDSIVFDLTSATECKFENRNIKLNLAPTIMSGKITNAVTQKPLAGTVRLKAASGKEFDTQADASGRYTLKIEGTVAGGSISVEATGHKVSSEEINFSAGQRHRSFEKNFELKSSAVVITGTVRNAQSNSAIPGATIKYKLVQGGKEGEVKANEEGKFKIEVEAATVQYALAGEAYGYRNATVEVGISPEQQNVSKDILLAPRPPILLYGKVINEISGEGISANMRHIALKNKEEGMAKSNEGGEYKIELPHLTHYKFVIKKDGYISIYEKFEPDTTQKFQEIERNFKLLPIDIGTTVRLNNIQFEFAKATLLPESFEDLDRLVELMNDASTLVIEIAGHTDDIGSDADNLKLSQKRSESVREYILSKGITADRVEAKGYGESKPLVANKTEKDRAINRRVEFRVLRK